mmetsp:Transcript_19714/g.33852  ORF Transcript_19714/g.33852 Transcript_19714/m.33852 type:complete len:562 (-) Transcript_19714:597-2282(-)|eukprot:CAMPEP_0196658468 /NCGR_PEP_ID=MMETSP1086-20130531/29793_1 /TAXON_ID=77921 /ORGANISM="Cyanoptyche  gloeocystis , Strain SAG4.97" /LENGTH=561 /DNA_ID=CAMNT_0041992055 /DNA_START=204 /DNA_END=1889 /DNA_ORIENTATION=-
MVRSTTRHLPSELRKELLSSSAASSSFSTSAQSGPASVVDTDYSDNETSFLGQQESESFLESLSAAISMNQSILCVELSPDPEGFPIKTVAGLNGQRWRDFNSGDLDHLREYFKYVIDQTCDLCCAYKPTLGYFEALGAAGMDLLRDIVKMIPSHIPIIMDAKQSDINTVTVFARFVFEELKCGAVTVTPFAGQDAIAPLLLYPGKMVFVQAYNSNPSAAKFQEYPSPQNPLYLQIVKEARKWGTIEQVAFEIGQGSPTAYEALGRVRAAAPERLVLIRGVWREGGDLGRTLRAGLGEDGDGVIVTVPQALLECDNPAQQIRNLRDKVNQATAVARPSSPSRTAAPTPQELEFPVVLNTRAPFCFLNSRDNLIVELFDTGCIIFGDHVQASGVTLPYYIDLRTIISNPPLFAQVVSMYAEIVEQLEFDRLAGIPYGSLPTATGLSLRMHRPMVFPRKEVKAHGTKRVIEGAYEPGETVVVIDDILISGKSIVEGARKIESCGLHVRDMVVFIDHESPGVQATLAEQGYRCQAVFGRREIAEVLLDAARINQEQFNVFSQAH